VLKQDKQFDSLHWFESARKYFGAEKARLEEGLDIDSVAHGLMGLQIWSQKLASISEEDAHNMQMVFFSTFAYYPLSIFSITSCPFKTCTFVE
jgi:WASH complex subunit 7